MAPVHYASRSLLVVFAALIGLTCFTVTLAYVDLGPLHASVGLAIAVAKGLLILVFFMNLLRSSSLYRLAAFGGLLWIGLLLSGALADFISRNWPLSAFW